MTDKAPKVEDWVPVKDCPHCGRPMVPTQQDLDLAENRMRQLEALEPSCHWDQLIVLKQTTLIARERYQRIMDEQTEFENKYC